MLFKGTLAEKLRAGGAGIPAFFTPTGANTMVHLGGEPIKYDHKTKELTLSSQPKEVCRFVIIFFYQLHFFFNSRECSMVLHIY